MKFTLTLLSLVLLASCGESYTEHGTTLTEPAEVCDTVFVPAGHSSDIAVGVNPRSGSLTITPISIYTPEHYAVVFKWQHGKLAITGDKAKGLYQRFNRGDKCIVEYREVVRVTKRKNAPVTRTVENFEFLDAKHVQAEKLH